MRSTGQRETGFLIVFRGKAAVPDTNFTKTVQARNCCSRDRITPQKHPLPLCHGVTNTIVYIAVTPPQRSHRCGRICLDWVLLENEIALSLDAMYSCCTLVVTLHKYAQQGGKHYNFGRIQVPQYSSTVARIPEIKSSLKSCFKQLKTRECCSRKTKKQRKTK